MTFRPRARIGIALVAAYAVAFQSLLLAVVSASAGATEFSALPICANAHSGSAGNGQDGHGQPGHGQAGHGQDCLDACLTGCCCGAPLPPALAQAPYAAPKPLQKLAAAPAADVPVLIRAAKAHRSRAPPAA